MLNFPCKSREFRYLSTWSIEFTEDFTGKYAEILTYAQTVCTRPFPPPPQLKKGPRYEANVNVSVYGTSFTRPIRHLQQCGCGLHVKKTRKLKPRKFLLKG